MTEANTANTRGVGLVRLRGCLKSQVCFLLHGGVAGPIRESRTLATVPRLPLPADIYIIGCRW